MKAIFEQIMSGLDEVEAYLAGSREGYKVHVPTASDETTATTEDAIAEVFIPAGALRRDA